MSVLLEVENVMSMLNVPYLIIGATARDIVMHYGYGAPIQRATVDVDFAIQVESWKNYNAVRDQLITNGFTATTTRHRLISSNNIPIDIVPFGDIELQNAEIAWPPDGDSIMSVRGFQDACDHAQPVLINEIPKTICPVASPEGLMILKLISWSSRARELRQKDANDIHYLLTTYLDIKNIKEDIYEQSNVAQTELYDWEPGQASCSLFGKECRKIISDETYAEISKLSNTENTANIERLAIEMPNASAAKNLMLLNAFMDGLNFGD